MRPYQSSRNAFAMIMAIFFMIVIATLLSYMLSSTTETAKRTVNTYVNEQAQLLAKSAVEYTILRVSGHDRSVNCLTNFNAEYYGEVTPLPAHPLFDINVTISYFGFGTGCTNLLPNIAGTIQTAESNGTMMIDVYVRSNKDGLDLSEPISYHRRTLQKL